jgi:hypothetical protein
MQTICHQGVEHLQLIKSSSLSSPFVSIPRSPAAAGSVVAAQNWIAMATMRARVKFLKPKLFILLEGYLQSDDAALQQQKGQTDENKEMSRQSWPLLLRVASFQQHVGFVVNTHLSKFVSYQRPAFVSVFQLRGVLGVAILVGHQSRTLQECSECHLIWPSIRLMVLNRPP